MGKLVFCIILSLLPGLALAAESLNETKSITCPYSPSGGGCKVDGICSFYCTKKIISFHDYLLRNIGPDFQILEVLKDSHRGKAEIKYRLLEKVKTIKSQTGDSDVKQ